MMGAAAKASSGLGGIEAGPVPRPRLPSSLRHAELAEWESVVGHAFRVSGGGRVRLVAVEPLPSSGRRPSAARARGFAAVFEAPAAALEGDRVYRLSHPLLPALPVHLGPAIEGGRRERFIAVFN